MSSNAALEEYANDLTYAPTPFSIPDKEWPQELKILFKDSIYKDGALKLNSFTLSTMICGAFLGAASGIFVDFLVRTLQYKTAPQFRKAHFEFVVVQLIVNVLFLIVLTKYSKNFLPWLELSLAGILFRVLYFLVQGNLAKNMALKRIATPDVIKGRSIRAARRMVYKRILRNRDPSSVSASEKARIEAQVKRMAPMVSRLSIRLQQSERKRDQSRVTNARTKKK